MSRNSRFLLVLSFGALLFSSCVYCDEICHLDKESLHGWVSWGQPIDPEEADKTEYEYCKKILALMDKINNAENGSQEHECGYGDIRNEFDKTFVEGDVIYTFKNPDICWKGLAGVAGYVLVRSGEIISVKIKSVN